jgi:hypothetical protein
MPVNPTKVHLSTARKTVLVPKDIIIPQKSYKAKREYKSATPLSDLQRILRKPQVVKRMGNRWPPKMW